ncbi:Formate/nitrite transporter family protein [Aspergillus niger]|uniref:Formate/nitrite transporter family protein n=1 Tax=Aspergillus niger TaxID=5061 RepID=A0A254U952_ASPNG|nr:hypothetical protein CBS133816_1118 [Aspergillus niger]KAI3001651.1 hypothetical protein CBS147345_8597 [Aspergillus niger]TPR06402.1 Formate/nitrite transporter family protein [Aspergillus niger]SPB45787.1 unnamed protein product [Aspergillus niger]
MEAVGSASAIIGIATTGIQCSIKLLTFADQIKFAPDEIANIAEDISVNASILQQLGGLADEALFHKQAAPNTSINTNISNGKSRVGNSESTDIGDTESHEPQNGIFNAAGLAIVINLASKCNAIFERLEEGLRKASKQLRADTQNKDRFKLSRAEMVKWPFVKPQMDAMRAELRDAKGTLMLMLQVAMLRYSKKVMEGHATRTSLTPYSQEDQYLLKRSIVAAERARIDVAKQQDDTFTRDEASSVTEKDLVDENFQSAEMTTMVAVPLQVRRPRNLGDNATREMPQISSVGSNNSNCKPRQDLDSGSALPKPSEADRVRTAEQNNGITSTSSANERLESSITSPSLASNAPLGVYLTTPKLQIKDGKHRVVYHVRRLVVARQDVDTQIDRWKETSDNTVLNQLLALSADEQEALDALNSDDGYSNVTDNGTLEWIHFGEYFPVDGVDNIRARGLTFIMTFKSPRSKTEEMTTFKGAEVQQTTTSDVRIDRRYVLPESLNAYGLPWKWDKFDFDYIIINKAMFDHFEDDLIAHTRRLNERYKEQLGSDSTELEVDKRKKYRRPGLLLQVKRLLRAKVRYSGEEHPAHPPRAHSNKVGEVKFHDCRGPGFEMELIRLSNEMHPAVPVETSPRPNRSPSVSSVVTPSPGPPTQDGCRPGPAEFRSSREYRPLWLVERFACKSEIHSDESLPSLPSSTTDVREPSEEEDDMEGIVNELLDRYTAA